MKKKYQIPTTEPISLGVEIVMVPNEMSDPVLGGANDYVFEEEVCDEWGAYDIEKPESKLWN